MVPFIGFSSLAEPHNATGIALYIKAKIYDILNSHLNEINDYILRQKIINEIDRVVKEVPLWNNHRTILFDYDHDTPNSLEGMVIVEFETGLELNYTIDVGRMVQVTLKEVNNVHSQ